MMALNVSPVRKVPQSEFSRYDDLGVVLTLVPK